MKLDFKKPHGIVWGHDTIKYTQDGKNFDPTGQEVGVPALKAKTQAEEIAKATPMNNAKAFLLQVLKDTSLSKSAVFKEAENNNHLWEDVKNAAIELHISKYTVKGMEMWKLSEEEKV